MSEDNSEHEITINPVRVLEVHVPMTKERMKEVIEPPPSGAELLAEADRYELNEYLNNLDLPDQSKAESNQQQDFVTTQKLIKKILSEAKDAAQHAAYRYMADHPEAKGLGFKFTGRVYAEKYKGMNLTQAFIHMLDCFLERPASLTTQTAIVESVKISTGIKEINANIWRMPLKKFMKKHLYERLKSYGMNLSLASCNNMSDVRKSVITYYAKTKSIHKTRLDITLTPDEIILNDTIYKITTATHDGYQYRRIRLIVNGRRKWLNADELKVLFGLAA